MWIILSSIVIMGQWAITYSMNVFSLNSDRHVQAMLLIQGS